MERTSAKTVKKEVERIKHMLPASPNEVKDRRKIFSEVKKDIGFTSHASFFNLEAFLENKSGAVEPEDESSDLSYKTPRPSSVLSERKKQRRNSEPYWFSWDYHVTSHSEQSFDVRPQGKRLKSQLDNFPGASAGEYVQEMQNNGSAILVEKNGRNLILEAPFSQLIDFLVNEQFNGKNKHEIFFNV